MRFTWLAMFGCLACAGDGHGKRHGLSTTTGTPLGTGTPTGSTTTSSGRTTPLETGIGPTQLALGLEYVEVGLMDSYSPTGLTWAKPRLEAFEWEMSEPVAPVGGVHGYDWSCPDAAILESQRAGFTHIQAYLSPRSPWGSVNPDALLFADIMVKPENEADLRLWIRALIERYDGDGVDDMPGLVAPVDHWVVGPEWTGFWPSNDHEDYLRFAQMTAAEARVANPNVELGTIPLLFADTFVGNEPTPAEIDDRLANSSLLRNSTEGIEAILDHPEYFDSVSVHALGHYSEIAPTLRFLEQQMADRGYDHPIWFDDAFPMGPLANQTGLPAAYPLTEDQHDAAWDLLVAIAQERTDGSPTGAEAQRWMEAEVAKGLVKKAATALGEGAAGIQLGNLEDWMTDPGFLAGGFRQATMSLIGASATFGLMDVTHSNGYETCSERVPGEPRPGFHALAQVGDLIGDGAFDDAVRIGDLEGPRGYRLHRGGAVSWVMWSEGGAPMVLPGDAAAAPVDFEVQVPAGFARLRVERVITTRGETAASWTVPVVDGWATLSLDDVPVIVRAE